MGVFADKPYVNGRYILSDTSKNYILEMNTLMNGLTMDDIRVLVGNRFRFPVYPDAEYMQTDILALDISQRAYNALRRGQISTIDQLANNINYEGDLRNFRNLGEKTAKEIMLSLLFYQYSHIAENRRPAYMKRLLAINGIHEKQPAQILTA